jgi:hypothetical protein
MKRRVKISKKKKVRVFKNNTPKYPHGGEHDEEGKEINGGPYTAGYTGENKVLTLKDNADWFNNHASYSDNPDYNDNIRKAVYSGKYGFNPYTGALHKLSKSKQGTPTEAEKIFKEDRRVVEAHLASLQKQAENEWKQGKVEVQIRSCVESSW